MKKRSRKSGEGTPAARPYPTSGEMIARRSVPIKALHAKTGEYVRKAQAGEGPIVISDRGKNVAVLAAIGSLPATRRKRVLLAEFAAMMNASAEAFVAATVAEERAAR